MKIISPHISGFLDAMHTNGNFRKIHVLEILTHCYLGPVRGLISAAPNNSKKKRDQGLFFLLLHAGMF